MRQSGPCARHMGSVDHTFVVTSSAADGETTALRTQETCPRPHSPRTRTRTPDSQSRLYFLQLIDCGTRLVRGLNKAGGPMSQTSVSTEELTIRRYMKRQEPWRALVTQAAFWVSSGSHISIVVSKTRPQLANLRPSGRWKGTLLTAGKGRRQLQAPGP